jgi:hypothetical protein
MATACLHNERRLQRIRGHAALPALLVALSELCPSEPPVDKTKQAP